MSANTSIILIAYHGDRWLPACLDSLTEASAGQMHLVLVDNAGNTVVEDLDLTGFQGEVLSTPHPMGFAEANNFALSGASHLEEAVLFLNQDTISPSGWIDECFDVLSAHPNLGAVSPLIRNYADDDWDPSFMVCLSEKQQSALQSNAVAGEVIVTRNAPAPALMVRTNVLCDAGPFDPVFGSYYEDYDLCRRIRELGYDIGFCTTTHVCHFSGGSTTTVEEERKRMRQVVRNRVLYQLRERASPRWSEVLHWGLRDFPRRLVRGMMGTPSSQPPRVVLKAYWDLMRLGRRVTSAAYDEKMWQRYLDEINWPPAQGTAANQKEGKAA